MNLKKRAATTYQSLMLFVDQIGKKDLFTQSAALSYYCALSLAPLVILLVTATGLLGPESKQNLIDQVNLVLGSQASEVVNTIVQGTSEDPQLSSISGIIGFIALLVSASSVFSQLKSTITSIFSNQDPCKVSTDDGGGWLSFLKQRVFSIGMMVSFILLSVISLVFSVVVSFVLPTGEDIIAQSANQIISFFIYAFIFFLVFFYIPPKRIIRKDAWIGGMIASFLFIVGRSVISLYLGNAAVSSAYGAAGSLIVLLVWVYYSSFIIFSAAIITSLLPEIKINFKNIGVRNEVTTKK